VTYSLVQQMGGNVDVQSEPDKGTAFTISLPSSQKQQKSVNEKISLPGREH
jgi:signal transduction histidine kinase